MKSSASHQIGSFGNEASRRLYRGAAETSQRLDQHLFRSSTLAELFSSEITDLRMRLKEYCERLIFTDPLEYGKKAEDLLWRKVFYDFFFRCKQNRKKLYDSEYYRIALKTHLLAGIGSYHHILLRIQTEFHINLEGKVDSPLLWHLKGVKKERWKRYQQSAASDGNIETWAIQACHRILIYLGDIERYIAELQEPENIHLAERYYQQAFCVNYKSGTPHNQLGSLYNNRFDSAYHYMRCLSCQEKFDGAEGNLIRVFEKNDEVLKELSSAEYCDDDSLKCSRFLSKFLKLCQIFYFSSGENTQLYCQDILKDFDNCMLDVSLPAKKYSSEEKSDYLSDSAIFKVIIMALICWSQLHDKGDAEASIASAFTLALFSHVVHNVTNRLLSSIYIIQPENNKSKNLIIQAKNNSLKEVNDSKDLQLDTSGDSEVNLSKKAEKRRRRKVVSKNHLRTFRRRRKISSTSQEDSELSNSEGEMSEVPESDEENCLSDVSQTGSCSSESFSENEDDLLLEQNYITNGRKGKVTDYVKLNGVDKINLKADVPELESKKCEENGEIYLNNSQDRPLITADNLVKVLKKVSLLTSLKILSDWLRTNNEILLAFAESSQFLLSRLINFFNILLKIEDKLLGLKDDYSRLRQNGIAWRQQNPLPEDIALRGFSILKEENCHLSFDVLKIREFTASSQVFLRIQCLLYFGRCLAEAPGSSISFDTEKNRYYFNLCNKVKDKEIVNPHEATNDLESERQQLMRSMAHLWLKAEVNDLEILVQGGAMPQLSPYLVADTSVLCYNLSLLKQLIHSKRFIIVIPLVVIANLDQLKKEAIGAREAIRWLEFELKKGCRFIRAQRQMEKISLVPMKYPKKKEKELWDFFQILECCNYLVQQQTNGKTTSQLVTLLVGSQHHLPDNASALSHSIDVNIENLGCFFSKWRNSIKNPG